MSELPSLCERLLQGLYGDRAVTAPSPSDLRRVFRGDAQARHPDDEAYGRSVVHTSDLGEVVLAVWRPGARSAIHDHGGAHGAVIVLEGAFAEVVYEFTGRDLVELARCEHTTGDRIVVASHTIHSMEARSFGLTLHAYVPSGDPVRLYDPRERVSWLASGGGAWLPSQHVVGSEPWAAHP